MPVDIGLEGTCPVLADKVDECVMEDPVGPSLIDIGQRKDHEAESQLFFRVTQRLADSVAYIATISTTADIERQTRDPVTKVVDVAMQIAISCGISRADKAGVGLAAIDRRSAARPTCFARPSANNVGSPARLPVARLAPNTSS